MIYQKIILQRLLNGGYGGYLPRQHRNKRPRLQLIRAGLYAHFPPPLAYQQKARLLMDKRAGGGLYNLLIEAGKLALVKP